MDLRNLSRTDCANLLWPVFATLCFKILVKNGIKMEIDNNAFAKEWVDSWNSHDIDRILAHYSDNFEITTPMIKIALGLDTGTLAGKQNVRKYWEEALRKMPDLCFELKEVTGSVNSIAIYYKSVMDKMAIEVMFFNDQGEVNKVVAHYTN